MPRVYLPKGTEKEAADKLRALLAAKYGSPVYMGFDDKGILIVVPSEDRRRWERTIREFFEQLH